MGGRRQAPGAPRRCDLPQEWAAARSDADRRPLGAGRDARSLDQRDGQVSSPSRRQVLMSIDRKVHSLAPSHRGRRRAEGAGLEPEAGVAQRSDPAKQPPKPFHSLQRRHVSPSRRLSFVVCRFLFIIDRQKSSRRRAAAILVGGRRPRSWGLSDVGAARNGARLRRRAKRRV
jgi:hypothetical protein